MAYLPNGSLADRIKTKGRLSEKETIELLIGILEGVSFAHEKGIIHRDIKASNIMFDENNNPILMDFGISKSKDSINLTISGSFIGTLEYSSPEQIESSDMVDGRSDIYSIGILAYEMITGSVPFKGSMTSVINQVVNTPPPPINIVSSQANNELIKIINKATQKKPEDRYQNAKEFIEDLKRIVDKNDNGTINTYTTDNTGTSSSGILPSGSFNNKSMNKRMLLLLGLLSVLLLLLVSIAVYLYKYKGGNVFFTSVEHKTIKNDYSFKNLKTAYGIEMIKVDGSKYLMGYENGEPDEAPSHPVSVKTFYITKTEITQYSWKKIFGYLPSGNTPCPDCPVVNVSWNDARDFALKLSNLTGLNISLPYECEWEYAAKGGNKKRNKKTTRYSGSFNPDDVGWYKGNSFGHIHAVAELENNGLGLFDMSGNVWEWCYDYYDSNYYQSPMQRCSGPEYGLYRVIRGGSFTDDKLKMMNTNREKASPGIRKRNIGFRLVKR
jgi:serine/threonine protein kinase